MAMFAERGDERVKLWTMQTRDVWESDCTVRLDDARGEQVVLFSSPVVTDFLTIEISSVYGGTGDACTCISDVRVLLAG